MSLIKMKTILLLILLLCSCMVLQIFCRNMENPILPKNLSFSRRLQGPTFGDEFIDEQSHTHLSNQQPINERSIRDLMTPFMAHNHRIPMSSGPSYNRPGVQNGPVNPSMPQNVRGPSSQTRYRQAMSLPSNSFAHSLENPRPQSMIRQEASLRKPNLPPAERPVPIYHQQSPKRPVPPRNSSPLKKDIRTAPPPRMQSSRHHKTASLDSSMADILGSSSTSQIRNKNSPKKIEVIHHLPLSMSPSRLHTHSPAVVYISNPKMSSPQSMYMRDFPETQMMPPSQTNLPHNPTFMMNGQDSNLPKINSPPKNNLQNPHNIAPKFKPFHQQVQTPYLAPPTGLQGKFIRDYSEDRRNLHLANILKQSPPAQVLRGMNPSSHTKKETSPSFARPTSTQNNAPRLNRLRQELNAEIQELLKLVSPAPAIDTKRPRIVPQRPMSHSFLAPPSQFEDTLSTSKQIKSAISPQGHVQNSRKITTVKNNPSNRQPRPHFSRPEKTNEQPPNRLPFPPVSDGLALNQRRPVVSESSVDSEELSEILKSVGYKEDSKFIRNAASVRPVKLIIPGENQNLKKESHVPSSASVLRAPSYYSKDLVSYNFNSFSSQKKNLKLPQYENVSSAMGENSPSSQNKNGMLSESEQISSSHTSDSSSFENTHSSLSDNEDVSSQQNEFSSAVDNTDSLSSNISDQNLAETKDSSYFGNEKNSTYAENEFLPFHQNHNDSSIPNNASLHRNENSETSLKTDVSYLSNNEKFLSDAKNATYSQPLQYLLHTVNRTSESNAQSSNDTSTDKKLLENHKHISNESLSLNAPTIKTYWDFRKLNGHLQAETSSPKLVKIENQPIFNPIVNNYQEEESIASISVKEDLSEEDLKEKNIDKSLKVKTNSGTLYDIYNKKILDEKKHDVPSSHPVRYLPQHYVPEDPEIQLRPNFENKHKSPVNEPYQGDSHKNINTGLSKVIYKETANFVKPKERIRNEFSAINLRERPIRTTTLAPKYLTTNRDVDSFQGTTPRYFITKAPYRQHFGLRNRPINNNNFNQKYPIPGRQQFNNNAFLQGQKQLVDRRIPQTHIQHYTNPRVTNYWIQSPTTESTIQSPLNLHSSEWKKFSLGTRAQNQFNPYGLSKTLTTTEIPAEIIHSSEVTEAESQIKNTQEERNTESSQYSETIRSTNKQFFRGPQHSIMFDDSTTESYKKATDLAASNSFETTTSSAAPKTTEAPETEEIILHNETGVPQYSVHTQTKVINALHLANRVFGRRNHTSLKQWITTTKMPRHKLTYAPALKPTTLLSFNHSESNDTTKKVVFNFRTGTTQSLPLGPSSPVPKIVNKFENSDKLLYKIENGSLEFVPSLKEKDKVIISPKNVSKASLFHHVVFSQPNISSKSTLNESAVTETNKDLYGILKPITKPYNLSATSVEENEHEKITTKVFTNRINSTTVKTTTPLSTTETISTLKMSLSSSTLDPLVSQSSSYAKNQYDLPTTTDSLKKDFKEKTSKETTVPYISTTVTQMYESTKDNLVTNLTVPPTEVVTEPVDQEQLIVDSLKSMKLKMQEMASKGLRHIMPLVMELSSDVSISSDCTFSLLRWLRAVRTMEQWAVRMMDASSKMPEGILYGTFSTFGSYDECVGIKTPKANLQVPYSGQYCSINIQPILPPKSRHFTIQDAFRKYPKLKQIFQEMNIDEDTMAYYYILKHRIGLCMPSTCSLEDLGNVTEKMADQLKMKISVERCETSEKRKLTKGQVVSMSSVFVAFGIVILATIVDITIRFRSDHEMDIDEVIRKKNALRQFSYVFSAYGNACKILDTSIPTTHLSALHGIKFLSISWVMLGHVYYCKDYLTLAGLNKVRDLGSNLAFQVVLNSAFAADTFFFLSGLLVVYSTFLYLENNNGHFTIVGFYIRRYWRLTPAFLMISGVILLGPLAGSGPIWHETLQPFVSGCENYWWTNLFYFSNFMPTDKTCVPHGWFLSCDMQFYIVAPIIILALYRRPKLGILLIILGILSSMITTGFLTFLYDLPPVSLFSLPDPKDINEYLDTVGYKPYTHYSSYCVGMATGFFLAAKQKISISRCLQTFGWILSTLGCCLVIYGTWNWNSGELPGWPVSVAYASTSRIVWCMGVAWLTVVCYAGHGGAVNSILSWHGFIPLSRLSYLAYLIHPLLMYLYASYVRSPFYFSQYVVVYLYLGHVCVTFGLAFLFSLAFEVPFLNLEKLITKYLDNSRRKRRASFSSHHNNWQHPEHPEMKDSVVLMRRRPDKFLT